MRRAHGKPFTMHSEISCEPQQVRILKAAIALLVSMALLGGSSSIASGVHGVTRTCKAAMLGVRYSMASGDPQRLQDMGDEAEDMIMGLFRGSAGPLATTWEEIPPGFADELFGPDDLGCYMTVFAPGTVGMVCDGDGEGIQEQVACLLEGHGWSEVSEARSDVCRTYVKERGSYRWAYVTCSDVSGTVTVSVSVLGPDGMSSF